MVEIQGFVEGASVPVSHPQDSSAVDAVIISFLLVRKLKLRC